MQVVVQDTIGNDHEISGKDSGIQIVIYSAKEGTHLTKVKSQYIGIIRPSFHVLPSNFGLVILEWCHKEEGSRGRGHLSSWKCVKFLKTKYS